MTPYQRAFQALTRHVRDCAECREHRPGCDEGKDLAEYTVALRLRQDSAKEAA